MYVIDFYISIWAKYMLSVLITARVQLLNQNLFCNQAIIYLVIIIIIIVIYFFHNYQPSLT